MRTPFSLAFAATMALTTPAASEDIVIRLEGLSGKTAVLSDKPVHERRGFDSSDMIVLDVSGSMEPYEIEASFKGVVEHYSSDKARADYQRGRCSKITMVFYAARTFIPEPQIVCSADDLEDFASFLDAIDIADIRRVAGGDTKLVPALNDVAEIYKAEMDGDVSVGQRRVVVVTDHKGAVFLKYLIDPSYSLTSEYGATVSAVTINKPVLAENFKNFLVTSEEAADRYFVLKGLSVSAGDSAAVSRAVEEVMRFTQS